MMLAGYFLALSLSLWWALYIARKVHCVMRPRRDGDPWPPAHRFDFLLLGAVPLGYVCVASHIVLQSEALALLALFGAIALGAASCDGAPRAGRPRYWCVWYALAAIALVACGGVLTAGFIRTFQDTGSISVPNALAMSLSIAAWFPLFLVVVKTAPHESEYH